MSEPLAPVLAGEHAVVWAYGVFGPMLTDKDQDKARTLLIEHEQTRDLLRAQILAADGDPPVAAPAYDLPLQPTDAPTARALAAEVEARLAAVYADLVAAATVRADRQTGVNGVSTCALRSIGWGGADVAFPGLPERAAAAQ